MGMRKPDKLLKYLSGSHGHDNHNVGLVTMHPRGHFMGGRTSVLLMFVSFLILLRDHKEDAGASRWGSHAGAWEPEKIF